MTDTREIAINQIKMGDCLDLLGELPDGSVNLIVTSPPYADRRKGTYGGIPHNEYVDWFCERAREMKRVLAEDGSLIVNIRADCIDGERSLYVMELVIALRNEVGFRFVEDYVWHKRVCSPGSWPNRFKNAWEDLFHFTKSKKFKINRESVMVPISEVTRKDIASRNKGHVKYNERRNSESGSGLGTVRSNFKDITHAYPSNVLHVSPEFNSKHSAPFPKAIPEFFIKLLSDEDDLVLDPFVGSGTTTFVARELGRRWLGFDNFQDSYNIACERMSTNTSDTNETSETNEMDKTDISEINDDEEFDDFFE